MDESKIHTGSEDNPSNENSPAEAIQNFTIEDIKYKTRLTPKFLTRKPYKPHDPKEIRSFIPGTVCEIFVKKGRKVKENDPLLELEAMKMLNTIYAPQDGVIESIHVKTGDKIPKNQLLIKFK